MAVEGFCPSSRYSREWTNRAPQAVLSPSYAYGFPSCRAPDPFGMMAKFPLHLGQYVMSSCRAATLPITLVQEVAPMTFPP